MNWFERYGIVGLYFVVSATIWDWVVFPSTGVVASADVGKDKLAVVLAALTLPAGYLLGITSQVFNYSFLSWKIHCKVWNQVVGEGSTPNRHCIWKHFFGELSESTIEAKMTVLVRGYLDPNDIERGKWVQQFNSRRWDVLAVNNSIILASFVSPSIVLCSECLRDTCLQPRWENGVALAILVVLIAVCCATSSWIMAHQIRVTMYGCYDRFLRQQANAQDPANRAGRCDPSKGVSSTSETET